ncbi:ATP-binding protein [uncultured Ruminococcus sp.]|uniref:ATP-binding protein n=1 Tax=uncultured Ruminococcus sp. TaxID=165186 RepID=UPI0025F8B0D9|nr:ATP-binding protein [uncultured Ruminococcus sp.]
MIYTKGAFEKAEQTLAARKIKAEDERAQRMAEIQFKAPEIYAMQRSLTSARFGMIKLIGSGKTNSDVKSEISSIRNRNLQTQRTIHELLTSFGYPEDYLQYHYFCPKCNDTGFHDGKRCGCFEKLLAKYTTDELNAQCSIVLHDFSEFRIDFYPNEPGNANPRERMSTVYKDCRAYADNFTDNSVSLFFFGKTGLGKTFLSSCIAKQLLSEGRNVFFGSILKLFRQIEDERFRRKEGDTTSVIIGAELVILDDLGSEFQTNFTDAVLYEIINERVNLGRPTIISTNLSMKELDKKYNDRIVSRLTGCFSPIMFIGSDVRQEKRRMRL